MLCKYCQIYTEIPEKNCSFFRLKNRVFVEKTCVHSKEKIDNESEACNHFLATSYFFCNENDQRYRIEVCLARQKNGKCSDCLQGIMIKEVARSAGLIKPSRIIDRKSQHKPIPIVRKKQVLVVRGS